MEQPKYRGVDYSSFILHTIQRWHYVAIRSVGCVCVGAPVRESLCLLRRETHTKGLTTRFPARPEVNELRKVPEKTESVDKGRQRRAEGDGRLEIAVQEKDGQQKEAVREGEGYSQQKMSALLVAFEEVSRKTHARDSLQMHGEC